MFITLLGEKRIQQKSNASRTTHKNLTQATSYLISTSTAIPSIRPIKVRCCPLVTRPFLVTSTEPYIPPDFIFANAEAYFPGCGVKLGFNVKVFGSTPTWGRPTPLKGVPVFFGILGFPILLLITFATTAKTPDVIPAANVPLSVGVHPLTSSVATYVPAPTTP